MSQLKMPLPVPFPPLLFCLSCIPVVRADAFHNGLHACLSVTGAFAYGTLPRALTVGCAAQM